MGGLSSRGFFLLLITLLAGTMTCWLSDHYSLQYSLCPIARHFFHNRCPLYALPAPRCRRSTTEVPSSFPTHRRPESRSSRTDAATKASTLGRTFSPSQILQFLQEFPVTEKSIAHPISREYLKLQNSTSSRASMDFASQSKITRIKLFLRSISVSSQPPHDRSVNIEQFISKKKHILALGRLKLKNTARGAVETIGLLHDTCFLFVIFWC